LWFKANLRQIVFKTLCKKNPSQKKVLVEWLKVKALSSKPVLQKKKERNKSTVVGPDTKVDDRNTSGLGMSLQQQDYHTKTKGQVGLLLRSPVCPGSTCIPSCALSAEYRSHRQGLGRLESRGCISLLGSALDTPLLAANTGSSPPFTSHPAGFQHTFHLCG
jgi:hypothetical protein